MDVGVAVPGIGVGGMGVGVGGSGVFVGGTVGGVTRVHPAAKAALKVLGSPGAQNLAQIMAAVGLAQNFAAIRALATEGIQRGHMSLHAKQVAVAAGASGGEVQAIASRMVADGRISAQRAETLLREIRKGSG